MRSLVTATMKRQVGEVPKDVVILVLKATGDRLWCEYAPGNGQRSVFFMAAPDVLRDAILVPIRDAMYSAADAERIADLIGRAKPIPCFDVNGNPVTEGDMS